MTTVALTDDDVNLITESLQNTYSRDDLASVLVVDGFGVSLRVNRGHLHVRDGIGTHVRTRRLSRADRTVTRILVLSTSGSVSLEALHWCTDVGIRVYVIGRDGRLKAVTTNVSPKDARVLRSQALAGSNGVGLQIARSLIAQKIAGQSTLLRSIGRPELAERLQGYAEIIDDVSTVDEVLGVESQAANEYFGGWVGLSCRFTDGAQSRVPEHWKTFGARRSLLTKGRSPANAVDPINALLNYAYSLGEAECRHACAAVGLDPSLGVLHTDKPHRDSLALDLLEPVRPEIERLVLDLLNVRRFTATDFGEGRDGSCRLTHTTTHIVAEWLPYIARVVAPIAESVAHTITGKATGRHSLRTPLTADNRRRANRQRRENAEPNRRTTRHIPAPSPVPSCERCGTTIRAGRKLCDSCWPVRRRELATGLATRIGETGRSNDWRVNSQSPEAAEKRSSTIAENRRALLEWERANPGVVPDVDAYRRDILPGLSGLPSSRIARTLGVSGSSASRFRSGLLVPHVRHWETLARMIRESQP